MLLLLSSFQIFFFSLTQASAVVFSLRCLPSKSSKYSHYFTKLLHPLVQWTRKRRKCSTQGPDSSPARIGTIFHFPPFTRAPRGFCTCLQQTHTHTRSGKTAVNQFPTELLWNNTPTYRHGTVCVCVSAISTTWIIIKFCAEDFRTINFRTLASLTRSFKNS